MSASTGTCVASKSNSSCGVNWKCHFNFPVSASRATTALVYRLSPIRESPFQSGPGLPTPQYVRFDSGSYEPVVQIDPPPVFHESPAHVSWPGSPGCGTVLNFQICLPVTGSYAAMNPLMPYSPPAGPTITLSLTTRGATVPEYPCSGFPIGVVHSRRPSRASMPTRFASIVLMNNVCPRTARPRLMRPQHARASGDGVYA